MMNPCNSAFRRSSAALFLSACFLTPSWGQSRDAALLSAATAEQAAVVQTLERLVNIETGTGNYPQLQSFH